MLSFSNTTLACVLFLHRHPYFLHFHEIIFVPWAEIAGNGSQQFHLSLYTITAVSTSYYGCAVYFTRSLKVSTLAYLRVT